MAALREQGIDPFGKRFERTANSGQLKEKYSELDKEQLHDLNETAIIAGRLVTKRGKERLALPIFKTVKVKFRSTFVRMQLEKKTTRSSKKADLGDFLGVEGEIMRTDIGKLRLKQLISLTCQKPFVPCLKNSTDFQMLKPSIANVIWI